MGGEASQVSYCLTRLHALGADIDRVVQAFEGKGADVRYDLDDLGHRRVVRALDDAHGDWDDKRELLVKRLTKLRDMVVESAKTFKTVDDDLAKKILEALEDPR